jgi:hypothetical protein
MNLLSSYAKITVIKNGEELSYDQIPYFYNSISRVFLSVKTSEVMKMEITLTPSYEDAIRILSGGLLGISVSKKSDKPEQSGSNIVAKPPSTNIAPVGVASDKTVVSGTGTGMTQVKIKLMRPGETLPSNSPYETTEYLGIIYQPEVSISGADAIINLKGYGYSSLSVGPKFMVRIPDGEKTALDVIKETLEYMDYDPNPEFLDDSVASKLSEKAPKRDANETLFNTLKWITGIVKCGFAENPQPTGSKPKMAFYDLSHSSYDPSKKAKYTCVQWRQVDASKNEIPMFDFKMDSSMLLFLQGQAFGTYKRSVIVDEKREEEAKQKDPKTDKLRNESSQTKINQNSQKKPGQFISIPDSNDEEFKKADAEHQEQIAKFQKFTFQIPGVPDIYIMDRVNMRIGDIAALQGSCLVRGVSHTLDNSGWNCDLEVTMVGSLDENTKKNNEVKISQAELRNENKLNARSV